MLQEDYEIYKLGDWELQSGQKIADAHIAFTTFGDPKSPALIPCHKHVGREPYTDSTELAGVIEALYR